MAVSIIDQFLDSLPEDWMRNVFVERLENARLLLDDETFGDKEGANEVLVRFLQLAENERLTEIERLRIRNQVEAWAWKQTTSDADLVALITMLRDIRSKKQQPDPEPEPEPEPENNGEDQPE